ncbi:thaumatin-like protein 1b [Lotus japonicus]|uniref:thaumatin-like protein 1b n=1 Tax=Lotus japonicus TaxID=34305 RepID=UPI00258B0A9A|nr:thaumatin-like protein 1b [Lotus japonicus]
MVQRWLSFLLLTLLLSLSGVISVTITLVNLCNYTLWPAAYTTGGNQTLSTTGFVLNSGESSTITVPAGWGGHLWGRTECSLNRTTGDFSCVTGDCFTGRLACDGMERTPPATRVEMTLNGDNNQDNYAISLIDGFNIPMAIIPLRGNCSSSGCRAHVNAVCPSGLKVTKWKERLVVAVACRSVNTCLEDCSYVHAVNILRKACPQARILADDNENTYSCASDTDYYITFCPPLTSESNNTRPGWRRGKTQNKKKDTNLLYWKWIMNARTMHKIVGKWDFMLRRGYSIPHSKPSFFAII